MAHVPSFIWLYKKVERYKKRKYRSTYKKRIIRYAKIKRFILNHTVLLLLYYLILTWVGLSVFFIVLHFIATVSHTSQLNYAAQLFNLERWMIDNYLLFEWTYYAPNWLIAALVIIILLGLKSVRKFLIFTFKRIWKVLNLLPGNALKALLNRYLMMAQFTTYIKETSVFEGLRKQYPIGTQFVILPMDMAYMGAGKINQKWSYEKQMGNLIALNERDDVKAFVFIDPRRIREEGKSFFDYTVRDGVVKLKPCFIKTYIEKHKFAGFKIYPALGYFPFDVDLLALWKYAADNGIPIMSHGVKGIIYYRGSLRNMPVEHPVFKESFGGDSFRPLYFQQLKNQDYQTNFTHPLNFLCLLEEPLLRQLLQNNAYKKVREVFGYTNASQPLLYNLSKLKVCFAHFGGALEWNKYLERDRDNYAQQLITKPETGIQMQIPAGASNAWVRYENLWKFTDWYSICCGMMMQYDNFYTDISYIVSNTNLYPLLRSTLSEASTLENVFNDESVYANRVKLRKRVLFGSDFYVVRSQKSDKDIFTELKSYLSEDEFDLIARENPAEYLKTDNQERRSWV